MNDNDIESYLFVSAYGRNQWLASELARAGHRVFYLDVTDFSSWSPSDWLGPYGFFAHKDVDPRYLEILQEKGELEESPVGFSFLFPEGPLDFKSALTNHRLGKFSIDQENRDYLQNFYQRESIEKWPELHYKLKYEKTYEQNWLSQLAHLIYSQTVLLNHQGLFSSETPVPFFSSYYPLKNQNNSLQRILDGLVLNGVHVEKKTNLKNLSVREKDQTKSSFIHCEGLVEFPSEVIWGLTTYETHTLAPDLAQVLFDGYRKPEWVWSRWTLKAVENIENTFSFHLPSLVLISDRYLALTQENYLILEKTNAESVYDLWVLLPSERSLDESYIQSLWVKIKEIFSFHWSEGYFELLSGPTHLNRKQENLGPFPHVKYNGFLKGEGVTRLKVSSLHLSQSEVWPRGDWHGLYLFQQQLLEKLAKKRREKNHDRSLRS